MMKQSHTFEGKRELDEVDDDGRRGHHMKQYVLPYSTFAALLEEDSWVKIITPLPHGTRILVIFFSTDFDALLLRCEHPDFPFVLYTAMIPTEEHMTIETWNA